MDLHTGLFRRDQLAELTHLQRLIDRAGHRLRSEVVTHIAEPRGSGRLPVHCIEMGRSDDAAPVIGFFGGVHGVERIGTQILIAYLHSLVERLDWDETLYSLLQRARLVFMPLVNPGGMQARTRCNPRGVDLMRNAPVEAAEAVRWPLGGQRLSRRLPWYRGASEEAMEAEAQALCDVVSRRILNAPVSITLDCHSGFGTRDQIWFPYAHCRRPIECLAEIYALRSLFRRTHPHHSIYVIEPQAQRYTTHGDLWDYLHLQSRATPRPPVFLPLTLELGSWLWVKKSPSQIFNGLGMFNPLAPHRHRRILRQHLTLLDFLTRATASHPRWLPTGVERVRAERAALAHWYGAPAPTAAELPATDLGAAVATPAEAVRSANDAAASPPPAAAGLPRRSG